MTRTKSIPDADVLRTILDHLLLLGDKAVTFATMAIATGLAAPTLVQRFRSRDQMVHAALDAGWSLLEHQTELAHGTALVSAKGAAGFLKEVSAQVDIPALWAASLRNRVLQDRAKQWRSRVELVLAVRLGGGIKGRDAAGLIFAAWQGRMLWDSAGGKSFRLGDAIKRSA